MYLIFLRISGSFLQGEKRKLEENGDPFPSKRSAPETDKKPDIKQEIKEEEEESKVLVEAYSSDEEDYPQQTSRSSSGIDERSRNCPYLDTINR